jgi:hypothetical protein
MNTSLNATRVPLICALGALAAWTLKSVAIGVAGGLGKSPYEDPLFLTGLACSVGSVVTLGLLLTTGRRLAVRIGACLLGVGAVFALTIAVDAAAHAVTASDHWTLTEVNLWVLSLALVTVTWWTGRGRRSASGRRVLVEDLA